MKRMVAWLVGLHLGTALLVAGERPSPNVLFLISDDLNCRIGCYGDRMARTPNLDRLAARGVRFDRAYCQFPLCHPTRCSVMTGRYPTTTRVLDNDTILMLQDGWETIQEYFARRGYAVAEFGKVWHGPNRPMRPGDPKPFRRTRDGTRIEYDTPEARARQQAEDPDYWEKHHSPYRNLVVRDPKQYAWANEFGPLPENQPGTDAPIANQAIRWLGQQQGEERPFFLAVGFRKPHVPLKAPARFFAMFEPAHMPLPPDFANQPQAAPHTPPDELRQNIDLFTARPFSANEARQAMRAYYACAAYMDFHLGRLLDALERFGARENTIIVFWGDHGWHLSEKGMWAKGTLFEVSARGPLIIVDPRKKKTAGRDCVRVVQYLDIYPTLVELCGGKPAEGLEGTSLVPLLDNPDAEWNRPAFTVQTRHWHIGRSVRTERWRYTEWDEGRHGAELYDHANDPFEMRNLVVDDAYADVVKRLRTLLRTGPIAPIRDAGTEREIGR